MDALVAYNPTLFYIGKHLNGMSGILTYVIGIDLMSYQVYICQNYMVDWVSMTTNYLQINDEIKLLFDEVVKL